MVCHPLLLTFSHFNLYLQNCSQLNGTKLGSDDLWEEENQICLNEVDPLRTLLLNKYNTYCPFVEFIQMGSLNVSMRIMIDFAEQKINC